MYVQHIRWWMIEISKSKKKILAQFYELYVNSFPLHSVSHITDTIKKNSVFFHPFSSINSHSIWNSIFFFYRKLVFDAVQHINRFLIVSFCFETSAEPVSTMFSAIKFLTPVTVLLWFIGGRTKWTILVVISARIGSIDLYKTFWSFKFCSITAKRLPC